MTYIEKLERIIGLGFYKYKGALIRCEKFRSSASTGLDGGSFAFTHAGEFNPTYLYINLYAMSSKRLLEKEPFSISIAFNGEESLKRLETMYDTLTDRCIKRHPLEVGVYLTSPECM